MHIARALTLDSRRQARWMAIGMMAMGALAIILPFYIGMAAAMLLGASIAISGLTGLWTCRRLQQSGYPSFAAPFWGYLLIGVLLLLWPQLTLGLAALLLGVGLVLAALVIWRRGAGWRTNIPALLTLLFGVLVLGSGASGVAWMVGMAFGLSLLQQGWLLWRTVATAPTLYEHE